MNASCTSLVMGVRAGVVVCVTSFLLGSLFSFYVHPLLILSQAPYLLIGLPIRSPSGSLPSQTNTYGSPLLIIPSLQRVQLKFSIFCLPSSSLVGQPFYGVCVTVKRVIFYSMEAAYVRCLLRSFTRPDLHASVLFSTTIVMYLYSVLPSTLLMVSLIARL